MCEIVNWLPSTYLVRKFSGFVFWFLFMCILKIEMQWTDVNKTVIEQLGFFRQYLFCYIICNAMPVCGSVVAIPVYLRHSISIREGSGGKLDITVGPKQTMGKTVSTFDNCLEKLSTVYFFQTVFTLIDLY